MADLLNILCCPRCKGELQPASRIVTPSRRIKSAVLFCAKCQEIAGAIRNFKYDFQHFDRAACAERLRAFRAQPGEEAVLESEVAETEIAFNDPRLELRGSWEAWDNRYQLSHGQPGDELSFTGEFLDVSIRLLKHPWSGRVRFVVDGEPAGEIDLYMPKWSTVHWFPIACDLAPGLHTVKVIPTGERNADSHACQVLFHELIVTRHQGHSAGCQTAVEINRTLPVFPDVLRLMQQVRPDGLILDCGGGDRVLADPRYVNLDCQQYQLPTVYGDALHLPFRTGVFDLVFSQALLEHVPNPFAAVEEMRRVASPGGIVWGGMAFMQPVHAVPSHYFNATTWGLQELFRSLEVLEVSWFGELSDTIDWLFKTAGVAEQMDPEEYGALISRIKKLDRLVSHQALREVASGVAVCARKPIEVRPEPRAQQ